MQTQQIAREMDRMDKEHGSIASTPSMRSMRSMRSIPSMRSMRVHYDRADERYNSGLFHFSAARARPTR